MKCQCYAQFQKNEPISNEDNGPVPCSATMVKTHQFLQPVAHKEVVGSCLATFDFSSLKD